MLLLIISLVAGMIIGVYACDRLTREYRKQIRKSLDKLTALLGIEKMPKKQSRQMNEILAALDAKKKRKRR